VAPLLGGPRSSVHTPLVGTVCIGDDWDPIAIPVMILDDRVGLALPLAEHAPCRVPFRLLSRN